MVTMKRTGPVEAWAAFDENGGVFVDFVAWTPELVESKVAGEGIPTPFVDLAPGNAIRQVVVMPLDEFKELEAENKRLRGLVAELEGPERFDFASLPIRKLKGSRP